MRNHPEWVGGRPVLSIGLSQAAMEALEGVRPFVMLEFVETIDEALGGVEEEGKDVAAGLAGSVKLTVVLSSSVVVVVAEEVRYWRWDAGAREDEELHEPSCATVAVSEGMNPGEVEVCQDRLDDCHRDLGWALPLRPKT